MRRCLLIHPVLYRTRVVGFAFRPVVYSGGSDQSIWHKSQFAERLQSNRRPKWSIPNSKYRLLPALGMFTAINCSIIHRHGPMGQVMATNQLAKLESSPCMNAIKNDNGNFTQGVETCLRNNQGVPLNMGGFYVVFPSKFPSLHWLIMCNPHSIIYLVSDRVWMDM